QGASLVMGLASAITVCLNDPGVGMSATPLDVCLTDADCNDKNPCTHDVCAAANGQCVHTPEPDGLPCDDQNACTTGNVCAAGACDPATGACLNPPIQCDDGNPCTVDFCDTTGVCQSVAGSPGGGGTCDDGNPCTIGDTCVSGAGGNPVCVGQPLTCDDDNS